MIPSFLRPEVLPYAAIEIIPAIVCCYCPDFDPTVRPAPGTSHGICPACIVVFEEAVTERL